MLIAHPTGSAGSTPTRAVDRSETGIQVGSLALAGAIIFGAFALRIWNLDRPSFWWDESYSTLVASGGLSQIVATLAREDYHPPLHYFILHFWMRLAGQSELALRFVSVGAGLLAVPAAWITARRLLGRSAAPFAAAIFALSPFLWYYSQEARMFALVPVLGTLSLYFCARAAEERRTALWAAYAVVVALGLYDLYYAIFAPFVCGLWLIAEPKRRTAFRAWCIATAAAFAAYLPWVPIFVTRGETWSSAFAPDNGPAKVIVWSWPEFTLGLPNLSLYQQWAPTALLGALGLVTLLGLVRAWWAGPGGRLAALAFVGTWLCIAAISAVKPVFHPRYAIAVVVGLYLVLAGLLDWLFHGPARSRAAGVIVVVILLTGAVYGLNHLLTDGSYARDDYRGAIGYVQQGEQPGDAIIHNAVPPFWYYFHGPSPTSYVPSGAAYTDAGVADELNRLTRGHPRLWYVANITIPNDPDGFIDTQLRLNARKLDERWYGPLRVQLWAIPRDDAFVAARFTPVTANVADELQLTGFSVNGEAVGGNQLDVELRWQTQRQPSADDGFWVGLIDRQGNVWGRADTRPRDPAYRPTSGWPAGETVVVRFDLPVALGTPPGPYQLVGGVYRLSDLNGLNVLDASGHALGQQAAIATLDVSKPTLADGDPSLPREVLNVAPGVTLVAHQATATALAPGDRLTVTLLWHATAAQSPMTAVLQLELSSGQVVARSAGPVGGAYPNEKWPVGALVREQRVLTLPAAAPAGPAQLTLVMQSGSSFTLGRFTIADVVRQFTAPRLAHPQNATLGDTLALVGYDLSATTAKPGDRVSVTLDWQDRQPTTTSYHVFVHLLDPTSHVVAQWDGVPRNWAYPTTAWLAGEYVPDTYALQLPASLPPEALTLEVGMYDAASGQRLPVVVAPGGKTDDRLVLSTIQVVKP